MLSPRPWRLDDNDSAKIYDANGDVVAEDYRFLHVDDFEAICRSVNTYPVEIQKIKKKIEAMYKGPGLASVKMLKEGVRIKPDAASYKTINEGLINNAFKDPNGEWVQWLTNVKYIMKRNCDLMDENRKLKADYGQNEAYKAGYFEGQKEKS